jgi:hypothetical protein
MTGHFASSDKVFSFCCLQFAPPLLAGRFRVRIAGFEYAFLEEPAIGANFAPSLAGVP